jgi:hypothetical protein
MEYPIDLGKKMSSPEPTPTSSAKDSEDKMYYPSLYLEWDDDYDLPDSGMMVVRFKKRYQTDRTDSKGDTHQSVELDIVKIMEVEPDKEDEKKEDRESILDKYMDEVTQKE